MFFLKEVRSRLKWKVFRLWHRIVTFFYPLASIRTKQGIFKCYLHDDIGKTLFFYHGFELDLIHDSIEFLLRNGLLPDTNATLIDIGANNGVIAIQMLNLGHFRRAIAIEPEPRNFALLEENIILNNFADSITSFNLALSDKKDTLAFELSKTNFGDHRIRSAATDRDLYCESDRELIKVPCCTLDEMAVQEQFSNETSLIWIDVQGHEGYVFRGGSNLLNKGIPVMAEIWPYGIARSGMSQDDFCAIIALTHDTFALQRNRQFIQYPINVLPQLFQEIGMDGGHQNVIFLRSSSPTNGGSLDPS